MAVRGPRPGRASRSPPRPTSSWRRCRTPASTSSTARHSRRAAPRARRRRAAHRRPAAGRIGIPASCVRLHLRAAVVHDRHARCPHRARRRPRRTSTPSCSAALAAINPGLTGQHPATPHQPPGPAGERAAGHLRPQRHHHPIRQPLAQRAGPRRRLRRAHPLELPHRRLPHLHHPAAVRRLHATTPTRSNPPPTGRSSSAAPSRKPTSSWTCKSGNVMTTPT